MNSCPKCNANWIGEEIPKNIAEHYSSAHWKREIGIDGGFVGIYDGLVALQCPDCLDCSPVSNSEFHKKLFEKFIEYLNENKKGGIFYV